MPADDAPTAPRIVVYCGSNLGGDPRFVETAVELGATLGERGIEVVYGGGHVGLMGALADAALGAGGTVIGVMPESLVRAEIAHQGLSSLEMTPSLHARKARMIELAGGCIALPGGYGTLDEVMEVLTWNQLGLVTMPVVFLDVAGYFSPLLDFLDSAVEANFMRGAHRMLAQRARSVEEAIALATALAPDTPHKWLDRGRQ